MTTKRAAAKRARAKEINQPDSCRFCGKGLTQEDRGADACEDCEAREGMNRE